MCGEKLVPTAEKAVAHGSPPHVRGKAQTAQQPGGEFGITPACAGKRHCPRSRCEHQWDHPRMCGEKFMGQFGQMMQQGSPPHVRGKEW